MARQIKGKGTVFGAAGAEDFYGAAAVKVQKHNLKDDFDKKYFKDEFGQVIGGIGFNGRKEIKIDLIPVGTTIAAAEAALKVPGKMARVVLSAFRAASTLINGNWIYEGGAEIESVNDDVSKITLPLVQYDTDISADVNA